MERRTVRRIHYGSSLLFSFIMIAGGVADLIPVPSNVAIFIHLGYPLYFSAMIGVAKLLGALALLYGRPLALKECPALLLILIVASYVAWKKSVPSAARNERLET